MLQIYADAVEKIAALKQGEQPFADVCLVYAKSYCSLGSDTRHSGEVIGGEGCCVLAPDWSTS